MGAGTKKNDIKHSLPRRNHLDGIKGEIRPLIMGVDPGLNGAICVMDTRDLSIVDMIPMPITRVASKSKSSGFIHHIDSHKIASEIDAYAPFTAMAIIEEPHAMPGQGLSSTFRFGKFCGQVQGVIAGHYIPTIPANPSVWKSALGLSWSKDLSFKAAKHYFPKYEWLWPLKKDDGKCEAALLCIYAHRHLKDFLKLRL